MYNVPISVIIPYFDIQKELDICLKSLAEQSFSKDLYEVIIVDNASTKSPDLIIKKYKKRIKNIKKIKLNNNKGPGIARNIGIRKAKGFYIFFLDADDSLPTYSLQTLYNLISKKKVDIVTYNWAYLNKKKIKHNLKPMRKDYNFFTSNKEKFLKLFISMNFESSVIFTMCRKKIFIKNKILFPEGLHEDILVMFQIYFYAKKILFEKKILYLKNNRSGSIVNTLSANHINGFFQSWVMIKKIIVKKKVYLILKTNY